jgi:hypothetical protein
MRILTTLAATIAAATLAVAAPANAAGRLSMAGTGTSEVGTTTVTVAGNLSGVPVSGAYAGTVTAPGGVPQVGECAPASADLRVGDPGGPSITLHSEGEVCSTIVPWVLQDFRGRFTVTDYSKRGWRNIAGFLEVRAVNGLSDVYANG